MTSLGASLATRRELAGYLGTWYDGTRVHAVYEVTKGAMPLSGHHRRDPDGKYREGGSWMCYQVRSKQSMPNTRIYRYKVGLTYTGSLYSVSVANPSYMTGMDIDTTFTECWNFGAQAIALLRPDKPDFTGLTSAGEMREVIHGLKDQLSRARKALADRKKPRGKRAYKMKGYKNPANDYLTVMMGVLPLISDVANFIEAAQNQQKRLDQLIRDANRPVRRRGMLFKSSTTNDTGLKTGTGYSHPDLYPRFATQNYASSNQWKDQTLTVVNREVWCSGKTSYLLPKIDGRPDLRKIRRKIMGGYLNADQVYNLIPWSWLVDYFTGLGHFMEAVSLGVSDSWYIHYAYIMDHRKVVTTRTRQQAMITTLTTASWVQHYSVVTEDLKIRTSASIFGWGFAQKDLSPRQASILGALGLSKVA